jgi:class 3 adenylate cyclase/tetratricopeptide (TPR) repeat protein
VTVCTSCGHTIPDGAKFCPECGTPVPAAAPAREQRKTVTLLFCDVTGSTLLGESTDPEALRALLARYFDRMKAIVERHGGTVEKFIGDAVMAVFGVPAVHEDDALRACRAAVEMRDALPELGIRGRIGVNTGEVVVGTAERLATGDPVNVAARLEQAAEPGEILIGAETRRLVRDAVELGPERALELKGKSAPVAAHPLLAVVGEGAARRFDVEMVGRERERRALDDAWLRAQSERTCHLFTLLGAAGVGKSRLTAEFLASIDDAPIVRGRCLSYGDGITYWPVVEIVLQLGARPENERAAAAISSLLGESDVPANSEDIAWAFRTLLEQVAPLVCVIDDLHWAEPTLLDLVDHVADWSRGAPILLVCIARPELLDRRPTWAGGKLNATTVLLEPLSMDETDELIERLLGDADLDTALRARIRDSAEGNPLFVEQMLAMVAESPRADVVVPPTIQALLAARLDQLEPGERDVLQRGAVEGKVFHRGGVQAMAPEEPDVRRRLGTLVRKELVRPDRAQLAGDEAFRFRHLLIRDAAYDALPKAARADLHERFADWLEHTDGLIELDEILGYHLEQAHRYRSELGLEDERTRTLGDRAAGRLASAAERAFAREDVGAASGLIERALALVAADARPLDWELVSVRAHMFAGRFGEALAAADDVIGRARRAGDRGGELRALLTRAAVTHLGEGESQAAVRPLAEEALTVFTELGDDAGLAEAWDAIGRDEHNACRFGPRLEAIERARMHAERAGRRWHAAQLLVIGSASYVYGPYTVEEALAWFAEHELGAWGFAFRAQLEAMRGDFHEARALSARAIEEARQRGQRLVLASSALHISEIELLADEPERAADAALDGVAALEELGEHGWMSTVAGLAAEALYRLGRDDEAWAQTEKAEAAGAHDDVITQMLIRQVRAKVLARRGEHAEAERLAREALAFGEPTDMLDAQGVAHLDLAIVLTAAGRPDEAVEELMRARTLFARKGNIVSVALVDRLLAKRSAAPATLDR